MKRLFGLFLFLIFVHFTFNGMSQKDNKPMSEEIQDSHSTESEDIFVDEIQFTFFEFTLPSIETNLKHNATFLAKRITSPILKTLELPPEL